MPIYKINRNIPSTDVNVKFLSELESYLLSKVKEILLISDEEFRKTYSFEIRDEIGTEIFNSVSEYKFEYFSDNIKKITLEEFHNLAGKEKEEWNSYGYCADGWVCLESDDSRYWNHSFDANAMDVDDTCVASRDIKKDEEVTWDYSNCLVPKDELPEIYSWGLQSG